MTRNSPKKSKFQKIEERSSHDFASSRVFPKLKRTRGTRTSDVAFVSRCTRGRGTIFRGVATFSKSKNKFQRGGSRDETKKFWRGERVIFLFDCFLLSCGDFFRASLAKQSETVTERSARKRREGGTGRKL